MFKLISSGSMFFHQVKSEVSKRDEEINELRELIEEDRAKLIKLQAIIERYSKHSGTGEISSTIGDDELLVVQDSKLSSSTSNRSRANSKSFMGGRVGAQVESDQQTHYSSRTVSTASHSRYTRPLSKTTHK